MPKDSRTQSRTTDENLYPEKPETLYGFKKAVAWYGGRELIASLKGMLMYDVFGSDNDPRPWMNPNTYPNTEEKVRNEQEIKEREKLERDIKPEEKTENMRYSEISMEASRYVTEKSDIIAKLLTSVEEDWAKKILDNWKWKAEFYELWEELFQDLKFKNALEPNEKKLNEFWFDYIADTGDGQLGVYNVACLCYSDIWIEEPDKIDEKLNKSEYPKASFYPPEKKEKLSEKLLLPRGTFLFIGGDTAYHSSNYATLVERFQHPFRWAFSSVREFTERVYRLKSGKKNLPADPEAIKEAKKLPGSIPGRLTGFEYIDTEPTRPIFGIPANHDYYDGIDGFNRQFRNPPFKNSEENILFTEKRGKYLLQIPTFSRKQEASYIAIKLPFDWWFFGIDSENKKLDFRQELYFADKVSQNPRKLIIATPEPTTVFGRKSKKDDKTTAYLEAITKDLGLCQPFLENGKFVPLKDCQDSKTTDEEKAKLPDPDKDADFIRLDLSGDVHHYARYWGEDTRRFEKNKESTDNFNSANYASVVAGGGGAFFDVTKTLVGKPVHKNGERIFSDDKIRGEIPPQKVFPSADESVSKTADKLFDIWNLRFGGYVQHAGFVIAALLFYFLTHFSNVAGIIRNRSAVNPVPMPVWGNSYAKSLLVFSLAGGFVLLTVIFVRMLINTLKDKSFKNTLDPDVDTGILQLFYAYLPFIFGILTYVVALAFVYDERNTALQRHALDNFLISCNFLVNFIIFVLVLWLSSEHTNWLDIRFKIVRFYKLKTDISKLENSTAWYLEPFKFLSRIYSYQYIFSTLLIITAFAVFFAGLTVFGSLGISKLLSDILLVVLFLGLAVLIIYALAIYTGAAYHSSAKHNVIFAILGAWHYYLQIATPLILFFYGSWTYLFLSFAVIFIFQGSGLISFIIRYFLVKENEDSFWNRAADFRPASLAVGWLNRYALIGKYVWFGIWVLYGLLLTGIPLKTDLTPSIYVSISKFVSSNFTNFPAYQFIRNNLYGFYNTTPEKFDNGFHAYLTIWLSILVVGYLGYLMSRIWLGWYLSVAMLFDGHNNEAGGAARIEGYKHIVRVKVEREQLTVYVIGFAQARTDMKDLKLKLVDKFTLTSQSINQYNRGEAN